MNHKKNHNRNNYPHNGNQGFQAGRGVNNNRVISQFNERLLMQRICDGAIVTLLTNAIAAASSVNSSTHTHQDSSITKTVRISSPAIEHDRNKGEQEDKNDKKKNNASSPSENKAPEKKDDKVPKDPSKTKLTSNSCQTQQSLPQIKSQPATRQPAAPINPLFENPLLQSFLASISHNQMVSKRKCAKGTQTTERILMPNSNFIKPGNNICAGFQQQQLINNTFLTSSYKFQGLAKTSSVYFTRGIR